MAISLAPDPWELARDALNVMINRRKWVMENRSTIRSAYATLGFPRPTNAQLDEMARVTTGEYGRALKIVEYSQWAEEFKDYSGKDIDPKYKKGDMRKKKVATMAYIETIIAEHGNIGNYREFLDARRRADVFRGSDTGRRLLKQYGYGTLVKAYQGRQDYIQYLERARFFEQLDPVMMQQFGRGATAGDVERIMKERGTVANYQQWLAAGTTAAGLATEIEVGDLAGFGVGKLSESQIQQQIYSKQGDASNLQARIEEARKRREARFTGGKAQIATRITGSGQLTQDLF